MSINTIDKRNIFMKLANTLYFVIKRTIIRTQAYVFRSLEKKATTKQPAHKTKEIDHAPQILPRQCRNIFPLVGFLYFSRKSKVVFP